MIRRIEYPLSMFLQQLHWAWRNWNLRPEAEEQKWHSLVLHFVEEIKEYRMKKAAKDDGPRK